MRALVAVISALGIVGCDAGSPGFTGRAQIDTLYGLQLGSLYPDVLANLEDRGLGLSCDDPDEDGDTFCHRPGASAFDIGPYEVMFRSGVLVAIFLDLSDSWRGVPVDSLLARMKAFGPPDRDTVAYEVRTVRWRDERSGVLRSVSCSAITDAGSCSISASLFRQ